MTLDLPNPALLENIVTGGAISFTGPVAEVDEVEDIFDDDGVATPVPTGELSLFQFPVLFGTFLHNRGGLLIFPFKQKRF